MESILLDKTAPSNERQISATNLIYAAVLASPVLAQGTHYEWLVATDTEAGRVRVIDAAHLTPEKDYFIGRIKAWPSARTANSITLMSLATSDWRELGKVKINGLSRYGCILSIVSGSSSNRNVERSHCGCTYHLGLI